MLAEPSVYAEATTNFSLLVVGRLHGLTRKRLRAVVKQVGGELADRPGRRVDLIAVAHASAPALLRHAPPLALPKGPDLGTRVVSEMTLKRMLRLAPAAAAADRTLDHDDLMRASKLSIEVLHCLIVFDVLEPVDCKFAYRDVLVAREVRRLINSDIDLATIVGASVALRRSRVSLSEARLVEAPWGEVVQEVYGLFASLDGQLPLQLRHERVSADDLFERAEVSEAAGDLPSAEGFYRAAMGIDRTDATFPYNLANVLHAQGRRPEAVLAYYEALQRNPDFAEAWYNLGVIEEEEGRRAEAIKHYRGALTAQPNFADALFNLALLLTEQESYVEAAQLWDRFLALSPHGPDTARARRCATLCRLGQTAVTSRPLSRNVGHPPRPNVSAEEPLLC